jgi:hypothetical protein
MNTKALDTLNKMIGFAGLCLAAAELVLLLKDRRADKA